VRRWQRKGRRWLAPSVLLLLGRSVLALSVTVSRDASCGSVRRFAVRIRVAPASRLAGRLAENLPNHHHLI